MRKYTRVRIVVVLLGLALIAVGPAASADMRGRCVSAEVPGEIVLPDESRHAPGQIRICLTRKYSPVAGLHTAYIDGKATGMFASRSVISEGQVADAQPFFLFYRNEAGSLELEGYALPANDGRLRSYRLGKSTAGIDTTQFASLGSSPSNGGNPSVVLLAAITE